MSDIVVLVVPVIFLAAWMLREYQFSKEREKMLDRLMAKSLPEFKYEARKEIVAKQRLEPKTSPSDAELAEWEIKHKSQVADNNSAIDSAIAEMKRKVSKTAEPHKAAGVSNGS